MVEGVRGGSEAAFEALFDRYHRGVLGFCRHMLGSAEEAEDAVQHTFLSAYRELAGSGKQVVVRPWLYTIARNRCLTMLRGRVRQSGGELVEPPTEHLAAAVERRNDLRDLLRDVAGLPEEQRSALVLSELGDMSHDEIADVLGCRRDKVKALVFQARSSLIASRQARETPCAEIREQLANLRGGSLRRNELRRHLSDCAGCRDFREHVRAQRRDLALVLPVAPTVGLKSGVIGAALGSSAAAPTAVVAGGSAASGALAAKVLVVAVIAGGGTVAVKEVAEHAERAPAAVPTDVHSAPAPARHESSGAPATPPIATPPRGSEGRSAPADRTHGKRVAPGRADTAPGHAKADHPGHAGAPGHGGKPAKGETPLGPAGKPEKPANAAAPGKPGKPETAGNGQRPAEAAKPGKAPRPAKGPPGKAPKPAKAQKPGKASKPAKAPKPAQAPGPVAASGPATSPKPPQASKPAKAPQPAGQAAAVDPAPPVGKPGKPK